jgi:hypothetical protein
MSSEESVSLMREHDMYVELDALCVVLGIGGVYRIAANDHKTALRHHTVSAQARITRAEWEAAEKNVTKQQARFCKKVLILSRELDAIEKIQAALAEQHYALRKKLEDLKP